MSALSQFATDHGFFTFMILMGLGGLAHSVFFRLPNRIIRHLNVRKAGWPPAHCDADGDFKKEEES